MAELHDEIPGVTDDPVIRLILEGKARNLDEAEEMYLDESLPEVLELLRLPIPDEELAQHPLIAAPPPPRQPGLGGLSTSDHRHPPCRPCRRPRRGEHHLPGHGRTCGSLLRAQPEYQRLRSASRTGELGRPDARLSTTPVFAGKPLVEGPSWRTGSFRRFLLRRLPDGQEEWLEFWCANLPLLRPLWAKRTGRVWRPRPVLSLAARLDPEQGDRTSRGLAGCRRAGRVPRRPDAGAGGIGRADSARSSQRHSEPARIRVRPPEGVFLGRPTRTTDAGGSASGGLTGVSSAVCSRGDGPHGDHARHRTCGLEPTPNRRLPLRRFTSRSSKRSGGNTESPPKPPTRPTRKPSSRLRDGEPARRRFAVQRDSRIKVAVWNRLGILVACGSLSKVIRSLTAVFAIRPSRRRARPGPRPSSRPRTSRPSGRGSVSPSATNQSVLPWKALVSSSRRGDDEEAAQAAGTYSSEVSSEVWPSRDLGLEGEQRLELELGVGRWAVR